MYAPFDFVVKKPADQIKKQRDSIQQFIPLFLKPKKIDITAVIDRTSRKIVKKASLLNDTQLTDLLKANKKIIHYIYIKALYINFQKDNKKYI